jgi:Flp pilus assembly protein TadG
MTPVEARETWVARWHRDSPGAPSGGIITVKRTAKPESMVMKILARFRHSRRAVAAVEFALLAPVLGVCLAAASDLGFREWSRSCLANAVAQGAYYAFRIGPNVSTATVKSLVQNASSLAGITATTSATVACYCPKGTPATLGPVVTVCAKACSPDGSLPAGILPGKYIVITATYQLTPFIPAYTILKTVAEQTITETATVRLQ